jgi:hypothetical protein
MFNLVPFFFAVFCWPLGPLPPSCFVRRSFSFNGLQRNLCTEIV